MIKETLHFGYISVAAFSCPYIFVENYEAMSTRKFKFENVFAGMLLVATWPISLPLTLSGKLPNYLEKRALRKMQDKKLVEEFKKHC